MWKTLNISCVSEKTCYMVKLVIMEDGIKVFVTDLKDLWSEEITQSSLLSRFQAMNPNLELKEEAVLTHIQDVLENSYKNTDFEITPLDSILRFYFKQKLDDFYIKFVLNLHSEDSQKFMEEVTVPFIHTVKFLEQQQQKLCDLLEKKDRELEEYRLERGLITRDDLITEKFDRSITHCHSEKLVLQTFDDTNFWNHFIHKFGNCDTETIKVEKQKWNNLKRKRIVYSSKNRNQNSKKIHKSDV